MQDRVAFLHHLQDAVRLFARNSKIAREGLRSHPVDAAENATLIDLTLPLAHVRETKRRFSKFSVDVAGKVVGYQLRIATKGSGNADFLITDIKLSQRHARSRLDETSHGVRQAEDVAICARIISPRFSPERVQPTSIPAVASDLQLQATQRINHPLVLVKDAEQRVSTNHALDQLGRATESAGFRVDRNRNALTSHNSEHGFAFENIVKIDFSSELSVELRSHGGCRLRRLSESAFVSLHIDWDTAPADTLELHHVGAANRCSQEIDAAAHLQEQVQSVLAVIRQAIVLQGGDFLR